METPASVFARSPSPARAFQTGCGEIEIRARGDGDGAQEGPSTELLAAVGVALLVGIGLLLGGGA